MAETNQELTQQYNARTQAAVSELSQQLELMKNGSATSDAIEKAAIEIARLRKDFADAISFLPSYDQRQFNNQLKDIEATLEILRGSDAPKPKFAFKRKVAKVVPSPAAGPTASTSAPAAASVDAVKDAPTSGLSISGHSNKYLDLSSVSIPWSSASDLTICDLDHCIVNLIPALANASIPAGVSFTALHVRNLSNTVLILPVILGSALLHDMKNCVIALGSRQFRMHTSSEVNVYIAISSNPIIEHCSAIRFADYPTSLRHLLPLDRQPDPPSNYLAVQDFSHIRATPSPNWCAIPEAGVVQEWPLATGDTSHLLNRMLPSSAAE